MRIINSLILIIFLNYEFIAVISPGSKFELPVVGDCQNYKISPVNYLKANKRILKIFATDLP